MYLRNSDIIARAQKQYGDDGHKRIKNWLSFIDESADKSEWQKIHLVNDFFNKHNKYKTDEELWHQKDYWATPLESLGVGMGDCEDYVIAKYFTLIALGVPEDKIVPIELRPGQLSVHHPWVVHGSGHNTSNKRRVGFAIQSYIGTEVEQLLGKTFVQLARGCDNYNHHPLVPRASGVMVDEEVATWHDANQSLREVLYHEAEKLGKY